METKTEKTGKNRKKTVRRAVLIVLCVLLLIAACFVIWVFSKLDRVSYIEDPEGVFPADTAGDGDSGRLNILVLGTDKMLEGTKDIGRCDSTTLCSLDLLTGRIRVISFERGIPIYVKENYDYELLTHVFHYTGAAGMVQAVGENFDVDIEGYVHVDFDTFPMIVDAIGGVDITLTQEEADILNGIGPIVDPNIWLEAEMHEGINHLSGHDTLQYCRLRALDDSYARQQRQRNTIQAMLDRLKKLSLPELNRAADELLPLFNTNLSRQTMTRILLNAPKFFGADIRELQVPEKEYNSGHTLDIFSFDLEKERIRTFLGQ